MFDLTSSKLLILGLVALIVVGPKELPALLRTIGKYMAIIRRQANEFRAQFDDAMRETELDQLKKDVEGMGRDMENTVRDAELSVEREVAAANAEVESALNTSAVTPPSELTPASPSLPSETPSETLTHTRSMDEVSGAAAEAIAAPAQPAAEPAPAKTGA